MHKILVTGSINTDMVVRTQHIPKPGETILGNYFFITGGGKGANQAVAAARLGGRVQLIAKLGNDVFGEQALENLAKEGIDISHVSKDPLQPSGVALIAVADSGENSIIVAPGANSALLTEEIDKAESVIAGCDYVLLQLEIPLNIVGRSIELARKHKRKVILNPAPASFLNDEMLGNIDIIIPNQTETAFFTGIEVKNADDAAWAVTWFHEKGIPTVIVTMADKGCFISDISFKGIVPAHAVETVVDTVAAGDTFCGALAVALSEGMHIDVAARFANIAAALAVTKHGAQASIPLRKEVDEIFNG